MEAALRIHARDGRFSLSSQPKRPGKWQYAIEQTLLALPQLSGKLFELQVAGGKIEAPVRACRSPLQVALPNRA